jgi:hypothetical protein
MVLGNHKNDLRQPAAVSDALKYRLARVTLGHELDTICKAALRHCIPSSR